MNLILACRSIVERAERLLPINAAGKIWRAATDSSTDGDLNEAAGAAADGQPGDA
jgi:hypothetical protein